MKKLDVWVTIIVIIIAFGTVAWGVHNAIGFFAAIDKFEVRRHQAPPVVAPPPTTALAPDIVTAGNGAFVRDRNLHAAGHYDAETDVRIGKYKLERVNVAPPEVFDAYEHDDTGAKPPPFALVFGDTTTKARQVESGTIYSGELYVVCSRYSLTREAVTCHGSDDDLGEVTFAGKIESDFAARLSVDGGPTPGFQAAAMTGDVTAGGKTTKGVSFDYLLW